MKVSFDYWVALLVLVLAVGEFGLQLGALQPRLRNCPWRQAPRLLGKTMLDDRIYLMGLWSESRFRNRDKRRVE